MSDNLGVKHPENAAAADLGREVDRVLLSFYAPASLVVTRQLRVIDRRGNLEPFGFPARFRKAPAGVVGDAIRRGIEAASHNNVPVVEEIPGARISILPIAVTVRRKTLFVVIFETPREDVADRIRELEVQLAAARNYLATAVDDYELTTEELQSAHEELKCANEELQSMNQELGSANENLSRLNASLDGRTHELQRANAELANLLNSVGIPMLMLGHDLTIRRFNPQAARFFNLQTSDIGKPIRDIRPSIGLPHLEQACVDVLDTFAPRSRQVQDATGRTYSLMMRPYRTEENRVDGVVLALVEKTALASFNA
jgi:two-component system CheB/CheR fusion protein